MLIIKIDLIVVCYKYGNSVAEYDGRHFLIYPSKPKLIKQ